MSKFWKFNTESEMQVRRNRPDGLQWRAQRFQSAFLDPLYMTTIKHKSPFAASATKWRMQKSSKTLFLKKCVNFQHLIYLHITKRKGITKRTRRYKNIYYSTYLAHYIMGLMLKNFNLIFPKVCKNRFRTFVHGPVDMTCCVVQTILR